MLFISYCSGRTSSTMLNVSDDGRCFSLFLSFEGRILFCTIQYYDRYISFVDALYQLGEISLCSCFSESLCCEQVLESTKWLLYNNWYNHVIFIFSLLTQWIKSITLMLTQLYIPGRITLVHGIGRQTAGSVPDHLNKANIAKKNT